MSNNKTVNRYHALALEKNWHRDLERRDTGDLYDEAFCALLCKYTELINDVQTTPQPDWDLMTFEGRKPIGVPARIASVAIRCWDLIGLIHADDAVNKALAQEQVFQVSRLIRYDFRDQEGHPLRNCVDFRRAIACLSSPPNQVTHTSEAARVYLFGGIKRAFVMGDRTRQLIVILLTLYLFAFETGIDIDAAMQDRFAYDQTKPAYPKAPA
jgi:hypothetical protein